MYFHNKHMQMSKAVPCTWLIPLYAVDCISDVYILPTTPMLLRHDLRHVRVEMLVSKLLICWWEKYLKSTDSIYFCCEIPMPPCVVILEGEAGPWYSSRLNDIHGAIGMSGMPLFMGGWAMHTARCMSTCMSLHHNPCSLAWHPSWHLSPCVCLPTLP